MNERRGEAVVATELTKSFVRKNWRGRVVEVVRAVQGVSFKLDPGETVAFIGANGAGKSTTLRMLSGILSPTSGTATLFGEKSGSTRAAMHFGLVSGNRSLLWAHLKVSESLEIVAALYGLRSRGRRERIRALSQTLEIEPFLPRRGQTLSLGERMRCEMAAAVIHGPPLLLADEPTLGLDILARRHLRELLGRWARESGTTLLLTSHDVGDIESLCARAILIAQGMIVYDGPTSALADPSSASATALEDALAARMRRPLESEAP